MSSSDGIPAKFSAGKQFVLHGLSSRPELNGSSARVAAHKKQRELWNRGRVPVIVAGHGTKSLSVRPANLHPLVEWELLPSRPSAFGDVCRSRMGPSTTTTSVGDALWAWGGLVGDEVDNEDGSWGPHSVTELWAYVAHAGPGGQAGHSWVLMWHDDVPDRPPNRPDYKGPALSIGPKHEDSSEALLAWTDSTRAREVLLLFGDRSAGPGRFQGGTDGT